MYKSSFTPSGQAYNTLRSGKIIGDDEEPHQMIERIVESITESDFKYTESISDRIAFENALGEAMDEKLIVMSTPIMTNAGRYIDRPLTACTVPTVGIRQGNEHLIEQEVLMLHEQGMGTGYNLDELEDPVEMLRFLNKIAVKGASSGKEDRPVGNMAVLSIYHPKIKEFIEAKLDTNEQWKFNLSVDVDEQFMNALSIGGLVTLYDGSKISSDELFSRICQAATQCGDPGLVFLDRMNARNPLPELGQYKTTAPCAEVGLLEGETCQFGYVNLAKFITRKNGIPTFDSSKLEGVSHLMTRALDDTLDISREQFISERSRYLLDRKRKIGIGICGVADALLLSGLPYDSPEGRKLIQDMLATVNFSSKEASIRLAESRGSCFAMTDIVGNRYLQTQSQLERLYENNPTDSVSSSDWTRLAQAIKKNRNLRNLTTVALPPTGRSAIVIDASTGIEPYFSLDGLGDDMKIEVDKIKSSLIPEEANRITAIAGNIAPLGHIAMATALQRFSDESLSKTINLPEGSTSNDVASVYQTAHESGMSGVTVYVDGTHQLQPKSLK